MLRAKTAKSIWVGDDVGDFLVINASDVDIEGDVNYFSTATAKNVDIFGDVNNTFSAHKLTNVNVWGDTNFLAMSGDGASISNSFFHDVNGAGFFDLFNVFNHDNINFGTIDEITDLFANSVKVRNSVIGHD